MESSWDKESMSFYLMGLCVAVAAMAAMCLYAMYTATDSVGFIFGVTLMAFVGACCVYAYPSPLNKVRSLSMFIATAVLCGMCLVVFILCDLVRLPIVFRQVEGGYSPNGMGIVALVVMSCGAAAAVLVAVRMILGALGKSVGETERKLRLEGRQQSTAAQEPRQVDERQVVAKAEQEVRRTRMSIVVPTEESGTPIATPPRRETTPEPVPRRVVRQPEQQDEPIAVRQEADVSGETEAADPMDIVMEAEPSILAARVDEEMPAAEEGAMPYGEDEQEAPRRDVAMARGVDLRDIDIRTEVAQHRPRQKEGDIGDDLYTDFSYAGTDFAAGDDNED